MSLLQLRLPHTWYNVRDNQISFQWGDSSSSSTVYLSAGMYVNVQDLVEGILHAVQNSTSTKFEATLDKELGRYKWSVPKDCYFVFPASLARLLGYLNFFTYRVPFYLNGVASVSEVDSTGRTSKVTMYADHTMSVSFKHSVWAFVSPYSFQNVYVHCNISEPVYVGSQMAKILLTHGVNSMHDKMENIIANNPTFYRLSQYEFRDIEIDIRDNLNRPIPFQRDTVTCTLYFRRRAVPV